MLESLHPLYAKKFRCIGAECEDVCCRGWEVTIDKETYRKYESLPALRSRMLECFEIIARNESAPSIRIMVKSTYRKLAQPIHAARGVLMV